MQFIALKTNYCSPLWSKLCLARSFFGCLARISVNCYSYLHLSLCLTALELKTAAPPIFSEFRRPHIIPYPYRVSLAQSSANLCLFFCISYSLVAPLLLYHHFGDYPIPPWISFILPVDCGIIFLPPFLSWSLCHGLFLIQKHHLGKGDTKAQPSKFS